jgi:hypothetical protein
MSKLAKALTAAAGNAGGESLYVEDVFSTYLYDGNGSTQTISNGINIGSYPIIDINNEGYAIGVNQTQIYNHTHSNLKAGDFVIVFNLITSTSSPTCTINGTTASILTQLENDAAYGYSYTIYTYQVGAGESSASISVSYGLGITTSLVVRGPTSVNLEQAMTQQTGSAAFGNNATTGYTLNFVVDRQPTANFTASATKEIIDTSYTYFAFDAWSQSGNGTSVPAFTATDSVSDSSAGAFASISFEGDGSDALSSSNGEGGLVWTKNRANAFNNFLYDTERGATNYLISDSTIDQQTVATSLTSFNSNGFTLGADDYGNIVSGAAAVSWTFRKAEKFFDVVTYTGTGVAGRTVAHNLGSIPACIIIKCTSASQSWVVYHTSLGATKYLTLNTTNAFGTTAVTFDDTAPTDSVFSVGTAGSVNGSGSTYVAYLFASDAGGFGDDGSESIIKCGSYTGNSSSSGPEIDLGFEPQWVLVKNASGAGRDWCIFDNMRGIPVTASSSKYLKANTSESEQTLNGFYPTATGFRLADNNGQINSSPDTYIYIAIRRPMKTPESGTEVFAPVVQNASANAVVNSGFPVDLNVSAQRNRASFPFTLFIDRLRGTSLSSSAKLASSSTNAEPNFSSDGGFNFASNTNIVDGLWNSQYAATSSMIYYNFKRATGFFDVVAYSGTGTNPTNFSHNLNVVPELMIFKKRSASDRWEIYSAALGNLKRIDLNTNGAATTNTSIWGGTPTATQFSLTDNPNVNQTGQTYIAYLFATLAGVSKVGSYTGTAADLNVDCGFSAGARFILIKRTDDTGDWYVWDSARGIVAGNDPYLLLNSTAAEVTSTDYIDPLSSGFTVTSSAPAALNASGGTYLFLAIA